MKRIKYHLTTAVIIIVWVFACNGGFAQTYSPAQGTVSNKPYAPAQATPTDSRSYFYDGTNFIWRPYQSTTEVLSYLNLSKYRTGNFSIYVNPTGTLNGDGTFTGGFIAEYWFKNGTANGNLVLKTDSTKANQQALIDTASSIRSILSSRFNPIAGTNITLTGTYPNITFNSSGGGSSTSITSNTGTGSWVSPSPITGTGTIGNDTTKLATRLYMVKVVDSMQLVPDTLVIRNSPTSGLGLAYPNLTNDTAFFKRLVQGYGQTLTQNNDSSITLKSDTSTMSTIAQLQKRVNDSSAVLRAAIGTGGGGGGTVDTFALATRARLTKSIDSLALKKQGKLTITSNGTTGASTLSGDSLNIPIYAGVIADGTNTTTTGSGTNADPYRIHSYNKNLFFSVGESTYPQNGDSTINSFPLAGFRNYGIYRDGVRQKYDSVTGVIVDTAAGIIYFHPPLVSDEKVIIDAWNTVPIRPIPFKQYNPATLPGIYGWYDASDPTTITISTGVSQWNNKVSGGPNLVQASAGAQPTYVTTGGPNGNSFIRFSSSSTISNNVSVPDTGSFTLFMVIRQSTWTNGQRVFAYRTNGGQNGVIVNTAAPYNGYTTYDGVGQGYQNINNDKTSWQLVKFEFSGAGYGKNGTNRISGSRIELINPLATNPSDVIINYIAFNDGNPQFDIAEAIITTSTISDINRVLVENYLINKYALSVPNSMLFFGDSHTYGFLSGTPTGLPYAYLTSKELNYDLMNMAVSGTVMYPNGSYAGNTGKNFVDYYGSVDTYVKSSGQYIIVQYGTNDGNNPSVFPGWKTNYKLYLQHFIDLGVAPNHIIICSPPYTTSPTYGTNVGNTRAVVEAIATEMGIKFADFYTGMQSAGLDCYTVTGGDGIHGNGPIHRKIADILEAKILE